MALKKTINQASVVELDNNNNDNVSSSISQIESMATPLWGGISRDPNELIQKVTSASSVTKRMYAVTIESTKAQIRMHVKREIIPGNEGKHLVDALDKIKKEIADGNFQFRQSARDMHESIEQRVAEITPEAAKWLNVARSKSSQVAGDLRLWMRDAFDSIEAGLQNLQASLIDKAEENVKTTFPGNAHGQLTQPISFGRLLMAYVEMFGRDRSRIKDARKRMNESPYSSGEMVGNSYHMNREMVARILGFDRACVNSMDAINSRDYAVEFLAMASNAATHLSRLSQEMIYWHSTQNQYISFSDACVTQNQVVPYRRDPEALEVIRGRAGTIYGALVNVLTSLKSLPLEFSDDYVGIAEAIFDAYDTLLNNIKAMSVLVADFKINRKQMKEASVGNFSTAIDLVDWIVSNTGCNLEKAQEKSRKLIEYAIMKGKKLSLLELSEIKKIEPKATDEIYSVLIPSRAMISRRSGNGSNPVQIRKSIRAARRSYL